MSSSFSGPVTQRLDRHVAFLRQEEAIRSLVSLLASHQAYVADGDLPVISRSGMQEVIEQGRAIHVRLQHF